MIYKLKNHIIMKKTIIICSVLTLISISFFSAKCFGHVLANSVICVHGGSGASACSIDAGVEIVGCGVSTACSVTCKDGYFACCAMTCRCFPDGTICYMTIGNTVGNIISKP